MSGFKHILLYSSGEKGATTTFSKVMDLAIRYKAKVTIVDVVELSQSLIQWIFQPSAHEKVRELTEYRVKRRLERLATSARDMGVEADAEVLVGKPFVELIRIAVRRNCDLMVNTARAQSGIRERLLGSTALHLMRKCPCPILVVRPKRRLQFTNILVPIDIRPEDATATIVNDKIMKIAISIAEVEGGQLHILHAWRPYGVSLLSGGRTRIPKDQLRYYIESYEKLHRDKFEEFLSRYSLDHLNHKVHFVQGDAVTTISKLAVRHRVNLVVMGTITVLGLAGSLIGSTAEEVLPQLNCSILTIKPEGFVTPVNVD